MVLAYQLFRHSQCLIRILQVVLIFFDPMNDDTISIAIETCTQASERDH
jgi:hypothetical protein